MHLLCRCEMYLERALDITLASAKMNKREGTGWIIRLPVSRNGICDLVLSLCDRQDMHDMYINSKMLIPQLMDPQILKNGSQTILRPAPTTGGVEPIGPRPSPVLAANHQDLATPLPQRNG